MHMEVVSYQELRILNMITSHISYLAEQRQNMNKMWQ